jgi:peptidoglycan/LPS O-acetylase OafA/YrhL
MKTVLTNTVNKAILLIGALLIQFSAFAADGNETDESRWQIVSRMPQFWIGVALFILLLSLGLSIGRNKNKQVA